MAFFHILSKITLFNFLLKSSKSQIFLRNSYCSESWTTWSECKCNQNLDYFKYRSREIFEQFSCKITTETSICSQNWSSWSDCDALECGKIGRQTRSKDCGQTEYQNCFRQCSAAAIEDYQNILNHKCNSWAEWSNWSQCSNSCNGLKTRKRLKMCSQEFENQYDECRNWMTSRSDNWASWNECEIINKCEPTRGRRIRVKNPDPCDHQANYLKLNYYELENCNPKQTDVYQTELSLQFSYRKIVNNGT